MWFTDYPADPIDAWGVAGRGDKNQHVTCFGKSTEFASVDLVVGHTVRRIGDDRLVVGEPNPPPPWCRKPAREHEVDAMWDALVALPPLPAM